MIPRPIDIETLKRLKECIPESRVETDMDWDKYIELNMNRMMDGEEK